MAALCASVKIGNPALQASGLSQTSRVEAAKPTSLVVRASAEEQSRRAALATIATTLAVSLSGNARALYIPEIKPPPPSIGGLPGTESSDQARDFEAPLKDRWFLQKQTPEGALKRAKGAVSVLPEIEGYISKKAWPYVRNELRGEFGYLRYDLGTLIEGKSKAEKKVLQADLDSLIASIEELDYAARAKVQDDAFKSFAAVSEKLAALLTKLG